MKVILQGCVMLLVGLIGVPGYATERLVPYDDFNATQIDPDKWFGIEFGPKPRGASTEAIRQIEDNRLRLAYRAYGRTDSGGGMSRNEFLLIFPNSAAVTAIQATVQVTDAAATRCPGNPAATIAWAKLGGLFFSTAPSNPGSAANNVAASIRLVRRSDSRQDVLRVRSSVYHCTNRPCTAGSILNFQDLGSVKLGEMVRLRVQWDQDNHRFIFQRDDDPEVLAPYAVSDTAPPGIQVKNLGALHFVPNCTATPRPMAFIEALFDDVMVNESAAPTAQQSPPRAPTAQQSPRRARSANGDVSPGLDSFLGDDLVQDASAMIAVETYRDASPDSEERIQERFDQIEGMLSTSMEPFPGIQKISWQDGVGHRVFGFRLGSGSRRLAFICHLDTVPPGDAEWGPFNARVEQRELQGEVQPFLVGRGAIDDKGPAAAVLAVLKALAAQRQDLGDSTVEVLFDTSEEVGNISIAHYFAAHGAPELGIVFDAVWAVRAEKGIARPAFELTLSTSEPDTIHIAELSTPKGPVNQIASSAQLHLGGGTAEQRAKLARHLLEDYEAYGFDDPAYRAAPATVETTPDAVILRASVVGAQHGSVPHLNRRFGANPLVSLLVFAAHLADAGVVAENGWSNMARFASFAFGTNVFGENHPDLLQAHDEVFERGNGTTYAVTRLGRTEAAEGSGVIRLAVDVRYATAHHATPWNGQPGLMGGPSLFGEVFDELIGSYREASGRGHDLVFSLGGHIGPDIRDPKSASFVRLAKAFEAVTGEPMPFVAIGGGTDAKGNLNLIAAGPSFFDPEGDAWGPPVNYHGENEGAPLRSLHVSARILLQLAQNFIAE